MQINREESSINTDAVWILFRRSVEIAEQNGRYFHGGAFGVNGRDAYQG